MAPSVLRTMHCSTIIHHIIGGGFFHIVIDFAFRTMGERSWSWSFVEVSLSIAKAIAHIT